MPEETSSKSALQIKPALVLGTITVVMSAIIIAMTNLLPDTSNTISDKLQQSCVSIMGEGEFSIVEDWEAAGYAIPKPEKNVNKLIVKKDDDSVVALEITVNGFNTDGITALVAVNKDGTVRGVAMVSVKDTPGYGDRTDDAEFLARFAGANGEVTITKKTTGVQNEVEGVTRATYSSRGVAQAVSKAIEVYGELENG